MEDEAHTVIMFSRPGCGLCSEAGEVIVAVRETLPFSFEEVSIQGNDELEREYGIRIPVILVDGVERFEYRVTAEELVEALR